MDKMFLENKNIQGRIRNFLAVFLPVLLVLHFFGWYKYFYDLNGYDKVVHFLAGINVVLAVLWFWEIKEIKKVNKKWASLIFLLLASVAWEVFEYLADHVFSRPLSGFLQPIQLSCLDTVGDFLADFLGGFMILFFFYFKGKNKDKEVV